MKKRFLSLLLCIMLLVSLLPTSAFATDQIQAYYFIGTTSGVYTKVYDGAKLQVDTMAYDGYLNTDTFQPQITKGNIAHVNQYGTMVYDETLGKNIGTLELHYDEGYPKVTRGGVDVTSEYTQTQVADPTFMDKTPGCKTFTIISRDITLKSANRTKEYDGTALVGGGTVTDLTAGETDKGYVSGEEFSYTFTGSQLFVGSSDNEFNVGNSSTALTTDYNVTKQYGTLTVTNRTSPLTITVTDQEKDYDGTATIVSATENMTYTVDGDLAYGDTLTVTLSNSKVNAGTYADGITATYKIMHNNGDGTYTDVTGMYSNVTVDPGDLTINKLDVTITSASDEKPYDTTPLTNDKTTVTAGSFVSGEGYVANVTGTQTDSGSSPNYFTVDAAAGTNLNNYNVTKVEGTLTVTGFGDVTITANSKTKMYDGTALTDSGYTASGLAAGHTATVTVDGTITHFGTAANTVTGCTIYDENGEDVTAAYNSVTTVDGTLSITKRDVTLTSGDATKKYDGTPLTKETVTASGSGFVGTEGATYNVTGSQTALGSSNNEFTYMFNNGTSADDYNITTVEGTLAVTQNDSLITITADSDSKMYDGTALTDSGYIVTGLPAGYTATVTVAGTITHFGTAANTVTNYTIYDENGEDVTSCYNNIKTVDGTLSITKRDVTLTSASDSWRYNGTVHSNTNIAVSGDGFVGTEGATYNVTGSQTAVGTSANTFNYTLNSNTSAADYNITTAEGTLEVTEAEFIITIDTEIGSGLEFLYDNTNTKVLTTDQYQVEGLATSDKVVNATITTNSANAGTYDEDMYTLTYDIVNKTTSVSTKSNYDITEYKHDVDITKRTITIEADSASKVYDGTALTCHTYTVTEGSTEEYKLLAGETVTGVGFTPDSTITHAGSTANKIDATNVTITKADGSDSSMNYNILTEDGTLTVTQRGVLLQSTSAEKFYDGTALQNRQVTVTGFYYDENGKVVVDDEDAGFLPGDSCTYDFVNDNIAIDKNGNVVAWGHAEQTGTAYGQTEVGTSKNEFNYNNFTSVYAGSYESDYIIMNGFNQESLGLGKDEKDLFGDLTVWGGPVEIVLTDYSWTYDYQAKTNGYFDDGYTVTVTTSEDGNDTVTTEYNNQPIALLGSDTIVANVNGTAVHHVGEDTQNTATYTIYRNGVEVTDEVEEYYQISIDGGLLQITPRTVYLTSASANKIYDGTKLTAKNVIEGSTSSQIGFIFGEGAAYEITGSQTEVGVSANTFAISELLTDTKETDYHFVMTEGLLTVDTAENKAFNGNGSVAAGSESIADVLGGTGYVDVKLTDAKTGTAGTNQFVTYVFDVTPYDANGAEQHNLDADITFRLPLYNPDNYAYADVYHGTEFVKQVALDETDTYIEVTAKQYSEYSYTLTNTARSSGNVIGGGSVSSYAVTVADATHGTVTASVANATAGSTVKLTVKSDKGWTLETITAQTAAGAEVEITPVTYGESYTFVMPGSAVTVTATFMEDNTMLNYFVDVTASDYYYDAVLWAAENSITSGVDATHFNPSGITTRGQMVTFLWRAAGSPEPTATTCKFTDVAADAYYFKAVLWAVEKGITAGISETEFAPNADVTRAQAVTFLWRYEGSKTDSGKNVFTDVATGDYFYSAVLWAKAQGITTGMTDTTFVPNDTCTRGQVVSFLYRDLVK